MWIDVNDRLPDTFTNVVVRTVDGFAIALLDFNNRFQVQHDALDIQAIDDDDNDYEGEFFIELLDKVTHWMYIPQIPKGDSK